MKIGEKIKALRKSQDPVLSRQKLAEIIAVDEKTIGRWENGISEPSVYNLTCIALYFNTSTDFFISNIKNEILQSPPSLEFPKKGGSEINQNNSIIAFTYTYAHIYNHFMNPILHKTADNLFSHFRVALAPDFIEALKFFPAQQLILTDLLKKTEAYNDTYAKILQNINKIDFFDLLGKYSEYAIKFCKKIGDPETNTFEKQFALSEPIINVLRKYMTTIDEFNCIISEMMSVKTN